LGLKYLKQRIPDETILHHYLTLYQQNQLNSLPETFEKILEHAKNRQGMPNSIGSLIPLRAVLYDFDPLQVNNNFHSWQEVFNSIQNNYTPPGVMNILNTKSYWVIFSKSIFSTAKFLSRFHSIREFKNYCASFIDSNPDIRIAFALLLSEEITGFGFALACDFLKEWVSPQFVKPDTHTKDIFIGTYFSESADSDFTICRRIIEFANTINQVPYSVDKLFWLIGSGRLHVTPQRRVEVRFQTSKEEFIQIYLASK
jgi:hypothetical protein